jgi:hypothetical protein
MGENVEWNDFKYKFRNMINKPLRTVKRNKTGTAYDIVTWIARALLGNGLVNTPRPNTHKVTIEDSPFLYNDL